MIVARFSKPAPSPISLQMGPLTAAYLALCLLAVAGMVFDARLFNGVPVWDKPLKFATSLALYSATLGLVIQRLSASVRDGRATRAAVFLAITCGLFEVIYIFIMAGRNEASHFNDSSAVTSLLYGLMGLGAFLLMVAVAILGAVVWRDKAARLSPALQAGIAQGFGLAVLLTVVIGFTLGGNGGHFVGIPGPDARTLPILGWSASVGDLRPPHFMALHAMQAGPLLGWIVGQANLRRPGLWVAGGLAVYTLLTLAMFAQALAGQPLIRL